MQFLQEGTGNLTIERETFNFIVSKFQRSKKRNYDYLVKAGKRFKTAVYNFTKVMCEEEKFPENFKKYYFTHDFQRWQWKT